MLESAIEVLLEGGLRAVTHRQVAARAQVPVGSIGYYCNSREELLDIAVERLVNDGLEYAEERLTGASASMSSEEVAELLIRAFIGGEVDDRRLGSWLTTTIDCARESEMLHNRMAHTREVQNSMITRILAQTGYSRIGARRVTATVAGAIVLCFYEQGTNCADFVHDSLVDLLENS